jgi:GNAT superfamily N-acetyltransferase
MEAAGAFIASHERLRVGGAITSVYDRADARDELPDGRFEADPLVGERNGWVNLIVVDPAWQARGIGSALFERQLSWLADQDVDMVFGYGWERAGRSSRPLFEEGGFVPIQRFDYAGQSKREACPDCGVWPSDDRECQCEYTLWAREGGGSDGE